MLKAAVYNKTINVALLTGCIATYGLSLLVQYVTYRLGIPVSTFVPLFNCNQIIIAFYAYWYLQEPISNAKWLAILFISGGCLLIGFGSKL